MIGSSGSDPKPLEEQFGIDGVLAFTRGEGGLTRIEIDAGGNVAEIYLHGAHVTKFAPAGHDPILWMSQKSHFAPGAPIRGGIPLCFPWFGAHPTDANLSNHGFVRSSEWSVESVSEDGTDVTVTFKSASNDESMDIWPHSFEARLTATIGATLVLTLEITNSGDAEFEFTQALHSYFSVSDIRSVTVQGLDGTDYFDKLVGGQFVVQRGDLSFTGETDRPYLDTTATCTITDPGKSRTIVVEKRGSATTVVWNPWTAKSRRMEDFGDDEWSRMLCIETANALRNSILLRAGESHAIGTTISAGALT